MAVQEVLDLNLSSSLAGELTRKVIDDWTQTRYARQQMDRLVSAWWERYEAVPPKRELPFKQASNLRVPLTMWVIDGIWVRLMRTIFGQEPYIRIVDENVNELPDPIPMELVLQHLNATDLQFRNQSGHLLLNALVEGTGILKPVRRQEAKTVRDRVGEQLVEIPLIGPRTLGAEVIDLKDFGVANAAIADINKQPWIGHRVWLTWDDIVRRQRDGIYRVTQDQLNAIKPLGKRRKISAQFALDTTKAELDKSEDAGWGAYDEYECIEFEYRYDVDGDGLEEENLLTVEVDYPDAPLRAQKFPFWNGVRNYVAYRPLPRSNRFYGRSVAGTLMALQDQLDADQNQGIDATSVTILSNLTPILNRSMKREWEKHRWKLAEPIYTDAPEQFRTLGSIMNHPIQLTQGQIGQILALAERTSGISDPQLGRPSTGGKTAFEIATVQSEGNVRFAEMIEQIQQSNTEAGYQFIEHAYQLAQEDPEFYARLINVCGGKDPFDGMTMGKIRRRWTLRPVGNSIVANRDTETKKWMATYQMLQQDPFVLADPARSYYLRSKLLSAGGLEQDIEKLIGTPEQAQQLAEQSKAILAQVLQALMLKQAQAVMQAAQSPAAGNGQQQPGIPGGPSAPELQGMMGNQSPVAIPG